MPTFFGVERSRCHSSLSMEQTVRYPLGCVNRRERRYRRQCREESFVWADCACALECRRVKRVTASPTNKWGMMFKSFAISDILQTVTSPFAGLALGEIQVEKRLLLG